MDVSPIIFDLETAPLPNVRDFLEPPDLSGIQAPSNYVKPEAIAGYIEKEKTKQLADFDRDCASKAALDFNLARIVALGYWTEQAGVVTHRCPDEAHETAVLEAFWKQAANRMLIGFSIREFDVPMLVQRSRYLGVRHRTPDLGRYAKGNGMIDLRDVLTFNDMRYEAIMPRSVKCFARRFGIPHTDAVSGADIPALVAAGSWDLVESHVCSDVEIELALARRLGVIQPAPVPEAAAVA